MPNFVEIIYKNVKSIHMKFQLSIFAIATLVLTSCGTPKKKDQTNSTTVQTEKTDQSKENNITEKYWKLITIEGQDVEWDENQKKEIHFILKTEENKITGFAGCNNFFGIYTLEDGNRIRFSKMASTMMACPDMSFNESEFLKIFELTDNYTINGDTLNLNVGRRAPLAVFEAVYLD